MEWLIILWPFGVGALLGLAIRNSHRWLAAGGAALIFFVTLLASFSASDDDWLISDRELLQAAALVWSFLWLGGVGLGAGLRRLGRGGDYDYAG